MILSWFDILVIRQIDPVAIILSSKQDDRLIKTLKLISKYSLHQQHFQDDSMIEYMPSHNWIACGLLDNIFMFYDSVTIVIF